MATLTIMKYVKSKRGIILIILCCKIFHQELIKLIVLMIFIFPILRYFELSLTWHDADSIVVCYMMMTEMMVRVVNGGFRSRCVWAGI